MPAIRSRTENWRQSLREIHERNGALEITLPHHVQRTPDGGGTVGDNPVGGGNLIWRVRIVGLSDTEILVEQPMALGQTIPIAAGVKLVAIIVIGQNRWMFETTNLGMTTAGLNGRRTVGALRLQMPDTVERCQRRNFYRISTIGLALPKVECHPLLDLPSAAVAETANRVHIHDLQDSHITGAAMSPEHDTVMPEVGPAFHATLVNIGGGGVGLVIADSEKAPVEAEKPIFMRIDLMPQIPAPVAVTGRIKHLHIDSMRKRYAGVAFEFGHNPSHQKFVVDQICRYVAMVQREQLKRG
ncbi:MAG TPA: hypothetical protein VG797_08380 [Phycisphaerales bacterium]|nr:hypothetical protein [Phycisphaerales bacterium]